ncbi:MAG: transcription factor E [Candidatus Heimdallarchaeum aukensis]|uniref:Transcription factor E n=1 Tax=Candidatus Heimdallarchaeum aukensis TaxID=2876573 RepID=A0A9Y1BJ53_9ARCH|nr:MAG: transcription factor E [Candidatus Heimdallarchaeum aukensis]
MSESSDDFEQEKQASNINITERQRQTLIEVVEDICGDEVKQVTLVLLNSDEEITDEEISEKLDMRLNLVRKSLYKLYDLQLASFRRIRDKNTGWFVYFWTLHPERIDIFVQKKQQEVLEKLQSRLEYEESNMFFKCSTAECPRFTFQEAMDANFICPKCGGRLEAFDNEQIKKVLKNKIDELKKIQKKTEKIVGA